MKTTRKHLITSQLDIEVHEICFLYTSFGRTCITIGQLQMHLSYRDPATYLKMPSWRIRKALVDLYPIHQNLRKRKKYLKITYARSKELAIRTELKLNDLENLRLNVYGIKEEHIK